MFNKYLKITLTGSLMLLFTGCSLESKVNIEEIIDYSEESAESLNDIRKYYSESSIVDLFISLSKNEVKLSKSIDEEINSICSEYGLSLEKKIKDDAEGSYEVYNLIEEDKLVSMELHVVNKEDNSKALSFYKLNLMGEGVSMLKKKDSFSIVIESISPLDIDRPEHSLGGRYDKLQHTLRGNSDIALSEVEVILNHKFTDKEISKVTINSNDNVGQMVTNYSLKNEEGFIQLSFVDDKLISVMYEEDSRYYYKCDSVDDTNDEDIIYYTLEKDNLNSLEDVSLYLIENLNKMKSNQTDKI